MRVLALSLSMGESGDSASSYLIFLFFGETITVLEWSKFEYCLLFLVYCGLVALFGISLSELKSSILGVSRSELLSRSRIGLLKTGSPIFLELSDLLLKMLLETLSLELTELGALSPPSISFSGLF